MKLYKYSLILLLGLGACLYAANSELLNPNQQTSSTSDSMDEA